MIRVTKPIRAMIAGLTVLSLAACSSETVSSASSGGSTTSAASGSASSSLAVAAATDYSSIIPKGDIVAGSKVIVQTSLQGKEGFTPPAGSVKAQKPGARIAYVAADLTDGGPNGIGVGLKEAAQVIGWTIEGYDGQGTAAGHTNAINQAIATKPDAIVLGSVDAKEQASTISAANAAGIPVFGWHSTALPGPGQGLKTNITTDPLKVAQLAAAYAVADSNGKLGAAIFTDSQYAVAVAKSDAMKAYLTACAGCKVLAVEDSPVSTTSQRMPGLISNLLQQYGDGLTYFFGINGNYFTGAAPALKGAGKSPSGFPKGVAAGNGDAPELQRIRNQQYQAATVAEPLYLQAWQLVDAVNATLGKAQIPDFVAAPGLIQHSNVPKTGDVFDPASGYRQIYKAAWGK